MSGNEDDDADADVVMTHKSARAILSPRNFGEMRIDSLESGEKRKGHAGELLAIVCGLADQCRLNLSLLPVSNSGMTLKRLRQFYASYGFNDYESGMRREFQERAAP
jgi:hypothetical protein